jgi:Tol biopolymer transport system component
MIDRRSVLRLAVAATAAAVVPAGPAAAQVTPDPREKRFATLRRLTSGGQNAEAYWDTGGTRLVFQSTRPPHGCDQIFTMRADGGDVTLVSGGAGRTTCGFFFPDGRRLIYASTQAAGTACPPPPDRSQGYVWPLYPSWDIYAADAGGGHRTRLTDNQFYDAECAVSPDGRRIVFTSTRDGDLDIYAMDADGRNVNRLTDEPGYDGGAFYSWDGRFVVFRASRPETREALEDYRALLGRGLVRPGRLDIYVMNADGTGQRRVTRLAGANFAPFMHPGGRQIVFSSNLHDPSGRSFALYLVNADGSGLERVTWADTFASFPMFTRDGARLVFCGNRGVAAPRDLDVFVADWTAG